MRVTPGALLLKLRRRLGHGLRVAYWRDVVRPRVLKTPPVVETTDRTCEIHVLTHAGDWLNLLWCLKSFYFASRRKYSLCIHEDGSLGEDQLAELRHHFPDARVISRAEADRRMHNVLSGKSHASAFRTINPLALKVFDFAGYLESERMLLLDSDILFFEEPSELLHRIEDPGYRRNTLNRDWRCGYTLPPPALERATGVSCPEGINSGLGLLHRGIVDSDQCEDYLASPGVIGHHHRIEQTLIALSCAQSGFEFLPSEYDVHLGDTPLGTPCRHYTGPVRHLMYREGMERLKRQGFLRLTAEVEKKPTPQKGLRVLDGS